MAACLDAATLASYAAGSLSAAAELAADRHVEHCGRCARALAELSAADPLLSRVREYEAHRAEVGSRTNLRQLQARVITTILGAKQSGHQGSALST